MLPAMSRHRFRVLIGLYERRKHTKRSWMDDKTKTTFWNAAFGKLYADEITTTMIEDKLEELRVRKNLTPATINRYRSAIKGIFSVAQFEGMIAMPPKVRLTKEHNESTTYLKKADAHRLLTILKSDAPMLSCMVRFSLATGLRQANVVHLRWQDIDVENKMLTVSIEDSKNKKSLTIPLNKSAWLALDLATALRPNCKPNHHVFATRYGMPIKNPTGHQWKAAMKKAGIEGIRWHDLRHSWATYHAMAGTPLVIIMKLGGWNSYQSVLRYAKYLPETTSQFVHNAEL